MPPTIYLNEDNMTLSGTLICETSKSYFWQLGRKNTLSLQIQIETQKSGPLGSNKSIKPLKIEKICTKDKSVLQINQGLVIGT